MNSEHKHELHEVEFKKTDGIFGGTSLYCKSLVCECGFMIGFEYDDRKAKLTTTTNQR
jgi:hypothetical protein